MYIYIYRERESEKRGNHQRAASDIQPAIPPVFYSIFFDYPTACNQRQLSNRFRTTSGVRHPTNRPSILFYHHLLPHSL